MDVSHEAKYLVSTIGKSIGDYFDRYSLEEIYTYDRFTMDDTLFSHAEINQINNSKKGFEKNILLK